MTPAQDNKTIPDADKTSQSGMTLEFLETASFWSNAAVVVLTGLLAIAGLFAWYFSTKLGDMKDEALTRFKLESEEKTETLAIDLEKQRERAANAEKDLLELQQRLAPRTVSAEQEDILIRELSRNNGEKVTLFAYTGSEEIERFTRQLEAAFKKAGITTEVTFGQVFGGSRSGITAEIGSERIPFAQAIGRALQVAKLLHGPMKAGKSSNPKELMITIGPK